MFSEIEIDPLAICFDSRSRPYRKCGLFARGIGSKIPTPKKPVKNQHLFAVLKLFAGSAASQNTHQQHLQATIARMTEAQSQVSIIETVGGDMGHALPVPLQTH